MELKTKPKKQNKFYWTKETEFYIRQFIHEPDHIKRDKIFNEYLKRPLEKLIENIVYTYKLYNYDHYGYDEIKQECLFHILKNINKFDTKKDVKAFSYFGTAVKNHLILLQKKYNAKRILSVSIDEDLGNVYGDGADCVKMFDNNVLNDIKYSYIMDSENKNREIFFKFIDELKSEILIIENMTEKQARDWCKFLNSFIMVAEINDSLFFVENKATFYYSLAKLNNFSNTKNYQLMALLKEKYFKLKDMLISDDDVNNNGKNNAYI